MPKQVGRHTFSGPLPSWERIPKESGIFIVQERKGTLEILVKTEASENLHAALTKYANSQSKHRGDDFFTQQQIYTMPLFSYSTGSHLTGEVIQHYKEEQAKLAAA